VIYLHYDLDNYITVFKRQFVSRTPLENTQEGKIKSPERSELCVVQKLWHASLPQWEDELFSRWREPNNYPSIRLHPLRQIQRDLEARQDL
jgi:hypothetical protein